MRYHRMFPALCLFLTFGLVGDGHPVMASEVFRETDVRVAIRNHPKTGKPETIPYRGHTEALFKRDFGSFWLDCFPDLRVLDYGFFWKRLTGLDNLTWWLFEKSD